MMISTKLRLVFGILLLVSFVGITACKKDKDTVAIVRVINSDGLPVPGATVRLFSSPSENPPPPNALRFDEKSVTNGSGQATFNFTEFYKKGQSGFAVLDIEAYKGGLYGTGIIKVEEEATSEESVKVE
ncbi:MAG: hypothetical protein IT223_01665 [Crocinitomicaceae bacterium]|nr:hypothetical protein [Crocinitomicaceae bacterium]